MTYLDNPVIGNYGIQKIWVNWRRKEIKLIAFNGNKGRSSCYPEDEFNLEYGIGLALFRAADGKNLANVIDKMIILKGFDKSDIEYIDEILEEEGIE
jgi:hypothetical protein